ncbi:MAG: DUF6506 family protein [Bacillota bacterium]|nr:DUF6506 family protein [Bacillota bacterium]
MLKFAFIMNVPGACPDTYSGVYENAESYNLIAATGSMEMTEALVAKLAAEGYELFNLCGDFDDEKTAHLAAIAGGGVRMHHAGYFPEELAKLEDLDSLVEYGIVVQMRGVEETTLVELKHPECNSYTMFVKDLDAACRAAKDLVKRGVDFIELCSWFDAERTFAVIYAIDGKVPVGSCGLL